MARDRDQRPETLSELFDQHRIELHGVIPKPNRNYGGSRTKLLCPECQGGRSKEKNFFIKVDGDSMGAAWCCFRASCGYSGGGFLKGANPDRPRSQPKHYRRPDPPQEISRPDPFIAYWAKQRISEATLQHFVVHRMTRRMPVLDADGKQTDARREMPVIAYPYRDQGNLTNVKYKAIYPGGHKRFEQEKDCEPTLYNIDSFREAEAGYFVEGENDCLAMFEAGFRQVTTVPNGSPPKLADSYDPATDEDERYIPLRPGDERIDRLEKCYLAGDDDPAGLRHMEEMARRLGKHRCWRVHWPTGCKDAFDTLQQHGPEGIQAAVARARPYPLPFVEVIPEQVMLDMYHRREGWHYTTGYASLDERLQLPNDEGQLIVCTGYGGSGKTTFLTSYAGLLTQRQEHHCQRNAVLRPFHTVILSKEVPSKRIARDLVSFHSGKPYLTERHGERVSREALLEVHLPWVQRHFTFLQWLERKKQPTISWIHEALPPVVKQTGAKLVIIDPWQEFDTEMPRHWAGTSSNWIMSVLCGLRGLAEELLVNLVLVAHPRKVPKDKNGKRPVPVGHDVAESQGFESVPSIGMSIYRPNFGAEQDDEMELHTWKVRDAPRLGKIGMTGIRFDPFTHRLYPRPTVAEAVNDAESA